MKNWKFGMLAVSFMCLLAFQTHQTTPKKYSVSLSFQDWQAVINGLEGVKNELKQTDLPSKKVTSINDSLLAPIQSEFIKQIQAQLAAENKKDTTKPKK